MCRRAMAMVTRLVSMVIQRRPHFSAISAVTPLPQVGSSMRSPGSVVMCRHRSITGLAVWTTYRLLEVTFAGAKCC